MALEVYLPKMSDHMETGRIVRWCFKEGDAVERGQILLELETDKAVGEVEAPGSGILQGVRFGEGEEAPVGETIAYILKPGEALPGKDRTAQSLAEAVSTAAGETPTSAAPTRSNGENGDGAVRATPLARKVARDLGVDLHNVTGSGPRGIIRDGDVRSYLAGLQEHTAGSPDVVTSAPMAVSAAEQQEAPVGATEPGEKLLPLSTFQQIAAQRMVESFTHVPHFYLQVAVDMTHALDLMEQVRDRVLRETGEKISITVGLVKAVAVALKRFPSVNAVFEQDHLRLLDNVNMGVAVGAERGLVVPVIKNADRKSLAEITRELKMFQSQAEHMRFNPEELSGGTFTISNLGMLGMDVFHAIINPQQIAILAVGRIIKTPVGMPDDTIVLRPMMNLALSADHRALDGLHAAQFLAECKALLENPYLMM